jgi:hypothetical protein
MLTLAAACAAQTPPPVTGPAVSGPVAAALSSFWRLHPTEQSTKLSINVPRDTPVDPAELRALLAAPATVTLFRDSSRYNNLNLPADSQGSRGDIYDIRLIPPSAWDSIVAADSALFSAITIQGAVYHVAREWCRGWPCHDGAWVDVRRDGDKYRGVVFAWWVE